MNDLVSFGDFLAFLDRLARFMGCGLNLIIGKVGFFVGVALPGHSLNEQIARATQVDLL